MAVCFQGVILLTHKDKSAVTESHVSLYYPIPPPRKDACHTPNVWKMRET